MFFIKTILRIEFISKYDAFSVQFQWVLEKYSWPQASIKCLQKRTLNIHNGLYRTKNRLKSTPKSQISVPSRFVLDNAIIALIFRRSSESRNAHISIFR